MNEIETGYEERFDFPLRSTAPELPYLLASVPRSGSTYFSHLIWQSGCLGAPLEYLNFNPSGPYGYTGGMPAEQNRLWDAALRARTSPNGAFGLKAFPEQLEALQKDNPELLARVMRTLLPSRETSRIVRLRRRDRTAHAISYARAILSGVWRSEQERATRTEPQYSRVAVERAARLIEDQETSWDAMFADLKLTPLTLWYEDVVAAPGHAIAAVASLLGVTLDADARVEIPEVVKQSQDGARDWAERHQAG